MVKFLYQFGLKGLEATLRPYKATIHDFFSLLIGIPNS